MTVLGRLFVRRLTKFTAIWGSGAGKLLSSASEKYSKLSSLGGSLISLARGF